ncbi:conserved hypothetical protein [Leifsonia xyli subsp. xyli str. CTCB07]|uniref:AbiEi antitoxin C-terminal domain-containing protein n=1 Tax=Leifsonia xyli subsp. xyli (strain CTCB07) TaxID=281090 RepID=Q6AFA8_LEIXX|nr:conserved hypothetical protein [Leifsonia xyli subsp. xyli str. CTCB07]
MLDGQLYRVGDAFAPPDIPDTAVLRARVFSAHRPGIAVADRGTAAWIHGSRSAPPVRPQVCVDPARRSRLSPVFDAQQRALYEDDTVAFDDVRVTTPLRTAADLLLTLPVFRAADALETRHLLILADASTEQLRLCLEHSRRSGVSRAKERITAIRRAHLPTPVPWPALSPR